MVELLNKILTNPKNDSLIHYLKLNKQSNLLQSFKTWEESYSGFNEGGCIFFDNYGELIPDECKYSLSVYSIMVNKDTGEIFACNIGRFSVIFKCNFEKSIIKEDTNLMKGYTLDCITDITELGDNWCLMNNFDNQQEELKWSFELTEK